MLFFPFILITLLLTQDILQEPELPAADTNLIQQLVLNKAPSKKTPVLVKNTIEPSMLTYKHWTGSHNPDSFSVEVNGKTVAQGDSCEVANTEEPVTVTYNYSFAKGMYKGSHSIAYKINEQTTSANITFCWSDKNRVILDNASPVK